MNTVVGKLLDADRQARQILDEAKAYYEKTAEEISREKERINTLYTQKAQRHIADLQASESAAADEAISGINAMASAAVSRLEETYENGHKGWEDSMFEACVKRVSFVE